MPNPWAAFEPGGRLGAAAPPPKKKWAVQFLGNDKNWGKRGF